MDAKEKKFSGLRINGFLALLLQLLMIVGIFFTAGDGESVPLVAIILGLLCFLAIPGYVMIEPNDMRVLLFFGKYRGTMFDNGFYWINPFFTKIKLTARARNESVEPIKVNDKAGNPVMIGLVLVWKVKDSYRSLFDIDSSSGMIGNSMSARMGVFQRFVSIQSDSALRNIASQYAYDNNESDDHITLRSGGEAINERLEQELNTRLQIAGIEVMEARINYLAYAPEIAAIMLRRQQASTIIAAREKIVEGAVSMVHMALDKLSTDNIVELDDDKKAAMVSNLLVVLCADEQVQPIINAGTLHN